ncbi:MAG TPA: ribonuclease H-like domain-containing protein [Bryobacteraceae bacterium]|nr:ribonuclease H-like domain-containing protein [Bryobacteraceae bacterium]
MGDLQQQLAELRTRIAKIDRKYASRPAPPEPAEPVLPRPAHQYVEEWLTGEEVETSFGRHFETEKLYERHRRHGSADIGSLADLPADLLDPIFEGAQDTPCAEWAFLDTETTGLSGGSGTCAFLVGVGRITPEGFRVRQFFMRDYAEEASLLDALTRHLEPFRVLITYNGRTFDQPLLETRYRLNRARPPFARMEHLDLLFGARRLWKLRFASCRLVDLENQILGVERHGDMPGALIPYVYFEYLRTRQAARMLPVFHHNSIDILTLACLTGIVPYAFKNPADAPLRHGAEMAGLARWLREAGETEQALKLFRRAIDAGLPDDLMFRTMWDIGMLERKLGGDAIPTWTDLASARNPFRVKALEELAKHHEHGEKNHARALELTCEALVYEDSADLRKREQRLRKKLIGRS